MYVCMLSHFSHVQLFAALWMPTRLLCPWDSPGKNIGLGHRALLWVYMYIWYLLMNLEKVGKSFAMKITLLKDIKLTCPSWVPIHEMAYYFSEHLIISKHLLLLYWLCQRLWLCGRQQTVENSSRGGNTKPPDLTLKKSVCRSGSNS